MLGSAHDSFRITAVLHLPEKLFRFLLLFYQNGLCLFLNQAELLSNLGKPENAFRERFHNPFFIKGSSPGMVQALKVFLYTV